MYRRSEADDQKHMILMRTGPVDDFSLFEKELKPQFELFCDDRVSWFKGVEGEEVKKFGKLFLPEEAKKFGKQIVLE